MSRILLIAVALLLTVARTFSELSAEEKKTFISRIEARVAAGDTDAVNDLTALPAKDCIFALAAIRRKNRTDLPLFSKCAKVAVTVPGGQDHMLEFLRREAGNNEEFSRQEIIIKFLVLNHTKTSVRILASTLDVFNAREMGPYILSGLAELNPPSSPAVPKGHEADPEVLAQWQQWWRTHKDNYTAEDTSK